MDQAALKKVQEEVQGVINERYTDVLPKMPAFSLSLNFSAAGQVQVKVVEALSDAHGNQPSKDVFEFVKAEVSKRIGHAATVVDHPDTRPCNV